MKIYGGSLLMGNAISGSSNLSPNQYANLLAQSQATQTASLPQLPQTKDTVVLSESAKSAPLPVYKNVEYMPELKKGVSEIIDKTNNLHAKGSGNIPLTDFVKSFGGNLTDKQMEELQKRGDISFKKTSENKGVFSNSGKEAKVDLGDMDMKIPKDVAGAYTVYSDGLSLAFDKGKKMKVGFGIFSTEINNIAMNREQVNVEVGMSSYNQTIMLSPKPKAKA